MNLLLLAVSVDQVNSYKQSFWQQLEPEVYFDDPVHEDAPHLLIDVILLVHVMRRWQVLVLRLKKVLRDGIREFTHVLRVLQVMMVDTVCVLPWYLLYCGLPELR